jgi:hypothetical protein
MRAVNWLVTAGACTLVTIVAIPAAAQRPAHQSAPARSAGVPVYRLRVLGVFDADSGEPLEGVEVTDALSGMKALTTNTGTVSLLFLPEGGSLVRLRKIGYEIQTMPVSISPADTQPITAVLKRTVILPTVQVKDVAPERHLPPLLQRFEDHRKMAMGEFITEAEFKKNDNTTLAAFLGSRLSGLEIINLSSRSFLVSSRTPCKGGAGGGCKSPDCFVAVYIDGVRVFDPTMPAATVPDISRFGTIDYTAAEFYPSGAPTPGDIASLNSQCGTLLLYTRWR